MSDGNVIPLCGREAEPVVADLLGLAQIHRPPADAASCGPSIAAEYAGSNSLRLCSYQLSGQIAGLVGVEPDNDRAIIRDLAVAPHMQRRGIGRALIDCLRGDLRFVSLEGDTLEPAVAFYRACAFDVVPDGPMPDGKTRYRFTWHM